MILLPYSLPMLPARGDKLFKDGKEVGHITSAIFSPALKANIALGYVRREANAVGTQLKLRGETGETTARVMERPLVKEGSQRVGASGGSVM